MLTGIPTSTLKIWLVIRRDERVAKLYYYFTCSGFISKIILDITDILNYFLFLESRDFPTVVTP